MVVRDDVPGCTESVVDVSVFVVKTIKAFPDLEVVSSTDETVLVIAGLVVRTTDAVVEKLAKITSPAIVLNVAAVICVPLAGYESTVLVVLVEVEDTRLSRGRGVVSITTDAIRPPTVREVASVVAPVVASVVAPVVALVVASVVASVVVPVVVPVVVSVVAPVVASVGPTVVPVVDSVFAEATSPSTAWEDVTLASATVEVMTVVTIPVVVPVVIVVVIVSVTTSPVVAETIAAVTEAELIDSSDLNISAPGKGSSGVMRMIDVSVLVKLAWATAPCGVLVLRTR